MGSSCSTPSHAIQRLEVGFDLRQVILELGQLRSSIIEMWTRHHQELISARDIAVLNQEIEAIQEGRMTLRFGREHAEEIVDEVVESVESRVKERSSI